MTADQTAELFTAKLQAQEPFVHIRFGDADYDWMMGGSGGTCDREEFRPGIGVELLRAWDQLWSLPHFYLGDIDTFKTRAPERIHLYADRLLNRKDETRLVHTEALLIHRLTPALLDFYRALRNDTRRKVLIAPLRVGQGAGMLRAGWWSVNQFTANAQIPEIIAGVEPLNWEVLLTCCGRASKLLAGELGTRHPERTIIEIGSGLDPLFVGRTRSEQVGMREAREYFRELL